MNRLPGVILTVGSREYNPVFSSATLIKTSDGEGEGKAGSWVGAWLICHTARDPGHWGSYFGGA